MLANRALPSYLANTEQDGVERSDTHADGARELMGIASLHTILRSCSAEMAIRVDTLDRRAHNPEWVIRRYHAGLSGAV